MKHCPQCHLDLAVSMFYRNHRTGDGLSHKCKTCTAAISRGQYRRNTPSILEYKKSYRRTDEYREKMRVFSAQFRALNPEKEKAHTAVKSALRSGSMTRPGACSKCGIQCKPQAHHDDYSKPLAVRWLCCSCHSKTHKLTEQPAHGAGGGGGQ